MNRPCIVIIFTSVHAMQYDYTTSQIIMPLSTHGSPEKSCNMTALYTLYTLVFGSYIE